ncbi:deaminase [Blattabacterium cuenoti]|uniref:deaminase n=1 Tax=Blattabacterium cuenoti TaxID=1653831 RepID=UPI00293BD330|nr:deaminase [Blattabacterium cuenoti]
MSFGYNKNPIKYEHECEDYYGNTKWYVLHAEANAILRLTYSSINIYSKNSPYTTIYVTHSPCKECSKLIYLSKIKRVVFLHIKNNNGLDLLKKLKIIVNQIFLK